MPGPQTPLPQESAEGASLAGGGSVSSRSLAADIQVLDDDDFSLVYCANCRKDAVHPQTHKLLADDFCIADCCQSVLCAKCFCGPCQPLSKDESPDQVARCLVCGSGHPRFVVLSYHLPPNLLYYFKPAHKIAAALASAATYQHATQSNHIAFLKKTCLSQRNALNKAKEHLDLLQAQLDQANAKIQELQQVHGPRQEAASPAPAAAATSTRQPSFANSSGGFAQKRKAPDLDLDQVFAHPPAGQSTKQRLGLDAASLRQSCGPRGAPSQASAPSQAGSVHSTSQLSDHVQHYAYESNSQHPLSDPFVAPPPQSPAPSVIQMPPPPLVHGSRNAQSNSRPTHSIPSLQRPSTASSSFSRQAPTTLYPKPPSSVRRQQQMFAQSQSSPAIQRRPTPAGTPARATASAMPHAGAERAPTPARGTFRPQGATPSRALGSKFVFREG